MRESPTRGHKKPRDSLTRMTAFALVLGLLCALLATSYVDVAQAASQYQQGYDITSQSQFNMSPTATTAVVDVSAGNDDIQLPAYASHVAAMWGGSCLDYFVLVGNTLYHYAWNGTNMSVVSSLQVAGLSNPIAAAASGSYPNAVVATSSSLTQYSYNGSSMTSNPALSVAGLTGVVGIGTRKNDSAALTSSGNIKYYAFNGTGMVSTPELSITSGLSNPIDMSLFPDTYDCVVLESNQAVYYGSSGGNMTPNPALAISGLNHPLAIAASAGKTVDVIQGNQDNIYTVSSGSFVKSSTLSITSGLTAPTCVAVRPGSYDRLIVDGNKVDYYSFDGTHLDYNAALSTTVSGLQNTSTYATSAVVQSEPISPAPSSSVSKVMLQAYCNSLPASTSVIFSLSADGANWTPILQEANTGSRSFGEYNTVAQQPNAWTLTPSWSTPDSNLADFEPQTPSKTTANLWATVSSGTSVVWEATMATTNNAVTPKIQAQSPGAGNYAVEIYTENTPTPPVVTVQGTYLTTMPQFTWADPNGFTQAGYEVLLNKQAGDSGATWSWSSNVQAGTQASLTVPYEGVFWGSGDYRFTVQVILFDTLWCPDSSSVQNFSISAIESPNVSELLAPAGQYTLPFSITQGMTQSQLPQTMAGGKIGVTVSTIGPASMSLTVTAAYGPNGTGSSATVETPPTVQAQNSYGAYNEQWLTEFYTPADISQVPDGTLVTAQFNSASGATLNLAPYTGSNRDTEDEYWPGYPTFANGVVTTQGSVYSDWFVVLQGRTTN
jgi:hypothetical protein